MRVNILDPGLVAKAGHHFDFDNKLLAHLAQAGHVVRVYGYAGMHDEVLAAMAPYGPVTRLFRAFQYGPVETHDGYAGEVDGFLHKSEIHAADLRAAEPADVWIWPTCRPYNVHACTLAGVEAPVVGCLHVDPGVAERSVGAMLWRAAFLAAQRGGLRFTPGVIEPELAERFAPIVPGGRCLAIPQPFDGPRIAEPRPALRRIGFLGQQRKEKGTDVLGPLLSRLVKDGYAITFQNSNRLVRGPAHPRIEVLDFVEDFAAPIAACDLVVLPYEAAQYAAKGSGILAQCLALGVPVVAPAGTMPGRMVERYGVGPLFAPTTAEAIYAAIKRADREYPAFARRAWEVADTFGKDNGVAAFARAFLSVAA